ncbi:MAG: hypothetical protein AB9866_08020 [Syntrophobacteraceae bacterium]
MTRREDEGCGHEWNLFFSTKTIRVGYDDNCAGLQSIVLNIVSNRDVHLARLNF